MDEKTLIWFRKQARFNALHQRYRDCSYYSCHPIPEGQDGLNCQFCYCPFYPCGRELRGGEWIGQGDERIWDCSDCNFVHRDEVVIRVLELFYEGMCVEEIDKKIQTEFYGENGNA